VGKNGKGEKHYGKPNHEKKEKEKEEKKGDGVPNKHKKIIKSKKKPS